ncbi:hypothetical protein [Nocardioides flavescens]|uniref:Uncharacterized protein n=1 Tax=Nocardioides flavescens TaxID=2691959 RepID=A0A6L7F0I3_9ACTN|nr:hypothetical protein [Nocardioides flavescens]MXG89971.1 hypothetical protein [Nocardioides flavescens]
MAGASRDADERPDGPVHGGVDKVAWSKAVVLLNVVLIAAVAIAAFRYTRPDQAEDPAYQPQAVATDTSGLSPSAATMSPSTTTTSAEPAPSADPTSPGPSAAPTVPASEVPTVRTTLRADFGAGDPWPVGAGFRETGRMAYSLGVVDRLMVHGDPEGPGTVSWLEKWTGGSDVRRLGARVLFAPNHSGSVALTAWHTSVLEASGTAVPRTGMRLVASPGRWKLVALDAQGREAVLATGSWQAQGRGATFDLVRKGAALWLTDPTGVVTSVTDPRVQSLSGPWAGFELREQRVGQRPAAFQEIWAG